MNEQQQEPIIEKGLVCPRCGCKHFEVLRTVQQDRRIARRRECRHCGRRVTTNEKIVGN